MMQPVRGAAIDTMIKNDRAFFMRPFYDAGLVRCHAQATHLAALR
jgi:hypothetical protein